MYEMLCNILAYVVVTGFLIIFFSADLFFCQKYFFLRSLGVIFFFNSLIYLHLQFMVKVRSENVRFINC